MSEFFDLENSYMVMGGEAANNWQTGLECVLTKVIGDNDKQISWLSHECRAETISPNIFNPIGNYEFVVLKGWNEDICIRSGSYNYGFNPIRNFLGKAAETTYETRGEATKVFCQTRKARTLSFEESLEFLHNKDKEKTNKIYMLIEYEIGSCKYELYAPCKYINYPSSLMGEKYLQPITGYVIFEDNNKFYMSYVAAHLREDGTKSVEFRVREMTTFINTKAKGSRLFPIFKLLDFIFLRFFFVTDDFTKIKRMLNAKCTLFIYNN